MRIIFIHILLLIISLPVTGQSYSKEILKERPSNLHEAVEKLISAQEDSTKEKILKMTEDEFIGITHFSLGLWIRNNWGLWKGKDLADYFNSLGIYHPDDMSGIILTSYYRELKGLDWKVGEQVENCKEYWEKSNEHLQRMKSDTAYQSKVHAQIDSINMEKLKLKKREWTPGKRVNGYLDYQCGFIDLGERTKVEGTIIDWQNDTLLVHIDRYFEKNKKNRVIKCNDIIDDNVFIDKHEHFRLIE